MMRFMIRTMALAVLLSLILVSSVDASHSLAGGAECGHRSFDADLIKGRTDSMLVRVEHTVGCKSYSYLNYVGADREEMAVGRERDWQMTECQRVGKLDVANFFKFYFDTEIDPATIRVSCSPYSGPD